VEINKKNKYPVLDIEKCRKCRKCIEICPANAIFMSFNNCCAKCIKYCLSMDVPCHPGEIRFSYKFCNACGICIGSCPEKAIYWFEIDNI